MRLIPLIAAALSLLMSGPSFAQGWIEYASRVDFFSINFPGEPKVRDITYRTEYSITLPGRVYSHEDGPNRYSLTVIDYSDAEKLHAERLKNCKADLGDGDSCLSPWRVDVRGAIVYSAWNFFQRDAMVTHYAYYTVDLIEGHRLQLTNADGTRTFAAIHMYENRLYILEGTVPPGSPAPGLFQQSLGFLDNEGKTIRYQTIYTNGFPPPPRVR